MKTKKKKYLPLYEKWMENGRMLRAPWSLNFATSGLCDAFFGDDIFDLMYPTSYDINVLGSQGLNIVCWASGNRDYCWHEFTPLRQTILLFMCALNEEL